MFSYIFTSILFITFAVHGEAINFNTFDKATLFGQFHNLIDNSDQNQLPCYRIRPNIRNAHPTDNTKYYICRDDVRFEVFTCPNGGIFDNTQKACIDLCEQKKPCLNKGQCIILANLTLQCVCRQDWTGERCEIPLSSCVNDPCGPKGECRMLRASDYTQDYVCICDNHQTYGRSCEKTVPNPCLTNSQQFHPFAFSRRAYINCDDELIFFQPCNGLLYWNQEYKRCDRALPHILKAPFLYLRKTEPQVQSYQWQSDNLMQQPAANQFSQQQNLPTLVEDVRIQIWSNQMPDVQIQTNQNLPTQVTATEAPRIFHLQGFSASQSGDQPWLDNTNNQFQGSQNFNTQLRSDQLMAPSFDTATIANPNYFVRPLRGWQENF